MDQVFYEAHWFLPGDSDGTIPGRLDIGRRRLELRLYGMFKGSLELLQDFNRQYESVRGLALDGTPITLLGCTLLNGSYSSRHGDFPVSVWHVSQVLVGRFIDKDDLKFRAVKAQFSLLDSFMISTGLSVTWYDEELRTLVSYQHRKAPQISIESAGVMIQEDVDLPTAATPNTSMAISARKVVVLEKEEPANIETFLSSIQHFRALISILTGFESRVLAIWCRIEDPSDQLPYRWGRFYTQVNQSETGQDALHPSKLRSTISGIGRSFGEVISEWYAAETRIGLVSSYFLSGYYQSHFMDQRLVAVTTALEIYHRTFHDNARPKKPVADETLSAIFSKITNEEAYWLRGKLIPSKGLSLRDRLRYLAESHVTTVGPEPDTVENLIRDLVEYRNAFSHGRPPKPRSSASPPELLEFSRNLLESSIREDVLGIGDGTM